MKPFSGLGTSTPEQARQAGGKRGREQAKTRAKYQEEKLE